MHSRTSVVHPQAEKLVSEREQRWQVLTFFALDRGVVAALGKIGIRQNLVTLLTLTSFFFFLWHTWHGRKVHDICYASREVSDAAVAETAEIRGHALMGRKTNGESKDKFVFVDAFFFSPLVSYFEDADAQIFSDTISRQGPQCTRLGKRRMQAAPGGDDLLI